MPTKAKFSKVQASNDALAPTWTFSPIETISPGWF